MTVRISRSPRSIAGAGVVACALAVTALVAEPVAALASTAPGLGTAAGFAVLAGTPAITNTRDSVISGSVGISPGASVTGFPPGTVTNGTTEAGTATAGIAKNDLTAAYGVAASSPCNFNRTGQNLGGLTLTPGTYCQTTAPTLTGTLTLSGNGIFIFQVGSTLVTAPGAAVVLTNGAQPCNVYWQVSSSATLDTTTRFVGTIMALASISLNDGASIDGRALAQTGQVTLVNNRITAPTACTAADVAGPTPTPVPTATGAAKPPVPSTGVVEPGQDEGLALVVLGLGLMTLPAGIALARRRRRGNRSIR